MELYRIVITFFCLDFYSISFFDSSTKIVQSFTYINSSFVSRPSTPGSANGLTLNPDKSEAIVFGTTQRSRSLPMSSTVNVAGTLVQVSNQVRILGVTLDSRLLFDAHISALSKSCFYHIRALRHIRPNLTLDCSKNIACSLVGCRLDYANSILVGSRLRTFLGFFVCKAHSLALSHVNGDASASPRLGRSFIGFLSSGA